MKICINPLRNFNICPWENNGLIAIVFEINEGTVAKGTNFGTNYLITLVGSP